MAGKTFIYVGAEADGLYRKEAGDSRWEKLAKGMPPSPQARAIAVHPNDASTVFVGTQRGVYRSKDGGDSFERMNMTEGRIVWSIKFHPHDSDIMFLGTEGAEVFKSTDGGENWQYMSTIANPDAVQMAFATRILGIGIEAGDTNQMYAALEVGGAAHSSDGGKTWTMVNSMLEGKRRPARPARRNRWRQRVRVHLQPDWRVAHPRPRPDLGQPPIRELLQHPLLPGRRGRAQRPQHSLRLCRLELRQRRGWHPSLHGRRRQLEQV